MIMKKNFNILKHLLMFTMVIAGFNAVTTDGECARHHPKKSTPPNNNNNNNNNNNLNNNNNNNNNNNLNNNNNNNNNNNLNNNDQLNNDVILNSDINNNNVNNLNNSINNVPLNSIQRHNDNNFAFGGPTHYNPEIPHNNPPTFGDTGEFANKYKEQYNNKKINVSHKYNNYGDIDKNPKYKPINKQSNYGLDEQISNYKTFDKDKKFADKYQEQYNNKKINVSHKYNNYENINKINVPYNYNYPRFNNQVKFNNGDSKNSDKQFKNIIDSLKTSNESSYKFFYKFIKDYNKILRKLENENINVINTLMLYNTQNVMPNYYRFFCTAYDNLLSTEKLIIETIEKHKDNKQSSNNKYSLNYIKEINDYLTMYITCKKTLNAKYIDMKEYISGNYKKESINTIIAHKTIGEAISNIRNQLSTFEQCIHRILKTYFNNENIILKNNMYIGLETRTVEDFQVIDEKDTSNKNSGDNLQIDRVDNINFDKQKENYKLVFDDKNKKDTSNKNSGNNLQIAKFHEIHNEGIGLV